MKVLITGAAGWTATAIIQTLSQARYEIIGFDLSKVGYENDATPLVSEKIVGDVSDFNSVKAAVEATQVKAIIHLAVAVGPDDYQTPDLPFAVNVKGTYNVFEAARQSGLQNIILLSSATVHLPHKGPHIWNAHTDWKSSANGDHLYDLTKRLQEEIAKDFCDTFEMQAIVLRAGHIVDGRQGVDPKGRNLANVTYCRGGWVCRYDLAQACLKALTFNSTGYTAYHIIGAKQARSHFDIDRTERELGLQFETRFENYR